MISLLDSWKNSDKIFLVNNQQSITYKTLYADVTKTISALAAQFKTPELFVIEASSDYKTYVKFISLLLEKHIVFLSPSFQFHDHEFRKLIESEMSSSFIYVELEKDISEISGSSLTKNELLITQIKNQRAGFIVRTSGTSGKKFKFILHDPLAFINKYHKIKNHFNVTMAFSPADSIAGIETLLEVLAHNNTLVSDTGKLSPEHVAKLIALHNVDYFQTTPSFLNLMLISGAFIALEKSRLQKIAYGSEPVLAATLLEIKKQIPAIEFKHTYGMSEFGILNTQTDQEDPSLFIIDQNINESRIVDSILEIKTSTQGLGYLNYENLNSSWFKTGDVPFISENGYMKVIGRADDIINVAGRKFYPSEVEDLLIQIEGVLDVAVKKEKNELIGHILVASFYLQDGLSENDFKRSYKNFCESRLPPFMTPHKLVFLSEPPITSRFKKSRTP